MSLRAVEEKMAKGVGDPTEGAAGSARVRVTLIQSGGWRILSQLSKQISEAPPKERSRVTAFRWRGELSYPDVCLQP